MATITFTGTGGIIEGNLGAANVNVNLDSSLYFDGNVNDDRMVVSDDNTAATGDFGTGDFSVSCWVYTPSTGFTDSDSWGSILGKGFTTSAPSGCWGLVRTSTNNSIYFQSGADAGGAWSASFGMSTTLALGAWTHICVTRTGASLIFYVNGVQNNTHTATETSNLTNSGDFKIGTNNTNSQSANITVSDVKLFDDVLTASEIQYLASKVQADPDVGGLDNCESWWKINEGTGTNVVNHKKGAANGTITGAEWQYDKFSVDVYDNSTTTDGTFTVTQGKVEGLGLSSASFDGSNDYIAVGNYKTTMRASHTWSLWFKATDGRTGSGQMLIGTTDASIDEALLMNIGSSNGSLSFGYITGGASKDTVISPVLLDGQNPWHLYTVAVTVIDSNSVRYNMFLDGVQIGDETHTGIDMTALDLSTDITIGAWNYGGFTRLTPYGGLIRDVRLYDYALSDEQMASLYSDTYPQTPLHHWMLDEGTGTTATDSGTSTSNGTYNGATHNNGTLDLDGTTSDQLRISANGTLSAPRGNLAIGGAISATVNSFENYGTFIHNNGTVTFDATADYGQRIQETASAATAFYNLTHNRSASSYHLYIKGDITVENILLNQVGFVNLYGPNTLTMGTTSSAGAITMTSSGIRFYNNDSSNYAKIYGASSIYPFVYTGNEPDIDTYSSNASHVAFKNGDIQVAMTGDYQGGIVRLDGDMEFDAVTVNSGDTLDLNGQRAEFSGAFVLAGALDWASSMPVFKHTVDLAGKFPTSNAATTIIHNPPSASEKTWISCYSDGTFFAQGAETEITGYGWSSGTPAYVLDKVVVGGMLDAQQHLQSGGDVTVATGGELRGNDRTVTVAGDFTTSGGLIGTSALETVASSSESASTSSNYTVLDNQASCTIEFWLKLTDISNTTARILNVNSGTSGEAYYVRTDGSALQFHLGCLTTDATFSNSDTSLLTLSNVGTKWHHYAMVKSGDVVSLYIDGKKAAEKASSGNTQSANSALVIGKYHGSSSNYADMVMDELRFYTDARTESEIRSNMFTDSPSGDNLVGHYKFDEGTGTTVADSSSNSNTLTLSGTGAWAGTGTLSWTGGSTPSAGTLNMTGAGTTPTLTCKSATKFFNLTAGTSGEVTLAGHPYIYGLLTVDANGITDGAGAETIGIAGTSTPVVHASQDFSNISQIHYQTGGSAITITPTTYAICRITNSTPATLVGALESTTLQVDSGCSLTAQNTTIQTRGFNINGANVVVNVVGTDITLTDASPYGFTGGNSTTTFSAGPGTTFTGNASKSKFVSSNNFTVVGKAENLDVTNEELSVTGQVINCTGDIIQQFPTIDHDQQLDYDTADDRDVILGRDLDKNTELINS